jgi:hypothetical protein
MSARIIQNDKSYFYVTSANWEAVIDSDCPQKAMVLAVEEMFEKFGSNFELAPVIIAIDMENIILEKADPLTDFSHLNEFYHIGYTPTILADAGYHKLSKQYEGIIKTD